MKGGKHPLTSIVKTRRDGHVQSYWINPDKLQPKEKDNKSKTVKKVTSAKSRSETAFKEDREAKVTHKAPVSASQIESHSARRAFEVANGKLQPLAKERLVERYHTLLNRLGKARGSELVWGNVEDDPVLSPIHRELKRIASILSEVKEQTVPQPLKDAATELLQTYVSSVLGDDYKVEDVFSPESINDFAAALPTVFEPADTNLVASILNYPLLQTSLMSAFKAKNYKDLYQILQNKVDHEPVFATNDAVSMTYAYLYKQAGIIDEPKCKYLIRGNIFQCRV